MDDARVRKSRAQRSFGQNDYGPVRGFHCPAQNGHKRAIDGLGRRTQLLGVRIRVKASGVFVGLSLAVASLIGKDPPVGDLARRHTDVGVGFVRSGLGLLDLGTLTPQIGGARVASPSRGLARFRAGLISARR